MVGRMSVMWVQVRAFLMGMHARLGADSPVQILCRDVIIVIVKILAREICMDEKLECLGTFSDEPALDDDWVSQLDESEDFDDDDFEDFHREYDGYYSDFMD
jgi:hypothetical protein